VAKLTAIRAHSGTATANRSNSAAPARRAAATVRLRLAAAGSHSGVAAYDRAMKKEIKIKPFWYSDIWLFPKLITIITTLDKQGRINAAPYSHIMQYDVMHKRPRMMLGFRQDSHTFENICATRELVINCPSADFLDDMMETARFYPEGVNELEHTRFTTIPSRKVKPPSIAQCPQIAECTVDDIIQLEKSSSIVIANIEAIVVDEGLDEIGREERIHKMNLPIGLGDEDRQEYFYARTEKLLKFQLKETPDGYRAANLKTELTWHDDAMADLMKIPAMVRKMVMKQTEKHALKQNATQVTKKHMMELAAEFGMDEEMIDRFRGRKKS
jgi:flavin reductase (DIM6/NTAB) family NADH-FMN oxidoreductase RutF